MRCLLWTFELGCVGLGLGGDKEATKTVVLNKRQAQGLGDLNQTKIAPNPLEHVKASQMNGQQLDSCTQHRRDSDNGSAPRLLA